MGNTETKDDSNKVSGHDQQVVQIITNQNQLMEAHDANQVLLLVILTEVTFITLYMIYKIIRRKGEKAAVRKAQSMANLDLP